MGKLHSKHGECILVNTQFGSSLEKLSDFDKLSSDAGWPDFSFDHSVWQKMLNNQEVSVCLKNMSPSQSTMSPTGGDSQLPLRVVLPPEKLVQNKSSRVLTMDQECNKKLNDSETTDDNKTLNVEEFECGVSVAGSDKQEWSFTLYDFDGKGKITKEDLGSLLRSLYDAVGSSINLPRSGTKTLKLRLTVSPDNSKVTGSGSSPRSKENKDKNDCGKDAATATGGANNRTKESKLNKDLDNSKLSASRDVKLDNISKAEQLHLDEQKVHHKEVRNNLSAPGDSTGLGTPKLTSVEQRHLAELVQKNMERHQQRQQQRARRHASERHKGVLQSLTNNQASPACEESRDRRNYYLDLAGIENDEAAAAAAGGGRLAHNTSAPAELLNPRLAGKRDHTGRRPDGKVRSRSHNVRRQHADMATGSHEASHQRSRSQDVPAAPTTPDEKMATTTAAAATLESAATLSHQTRLIERAVEEKVEKCMSAAHKAMTSTPTNKNHRLRPVSLPPNVPETASPHHHRRHRNRERNRKLAMQQVAEWIEREHAWAGGGGGGEAGGSGGGGGERVIVQRHEHHHIHEHHHHHHYHHYHET